MVWSIKGDASIERDLDVGRSLTITAKNATTPFLTSKFSDGSTASEFRTGGIGKNNLLWGSGAGGSLTDGYGNLAIGQQALTSVTIGNFNVAHGIGALGQLVDGGYNVAIGYCALYTSAHGNYNAAIGYTSLFLSTTGANNCAVGYQSMYSNTEGSGNTGLGFSVLYHNVTGSYNSALGYNAGPASSLSGTVALGVDNLGNAATPDENNAFMLGVAAHKVKIPSGGLQLLNNGYKYTLTRAVLTNDRLFSLPDSNGVSGQVLGTDGAGNTSWMSTLSPDKVVTHQLNGAGGGLLVYDNASGRYISSGPNIVVDQSGNIVVAA